MRPALSASLAIAATGLIGSAAVQAQGVLIGRVAHVHDGATITLQQIGPEGVVRLAGIAVPALDQPQGRESRIALNRCAFGRQVVIEVHGTDARGRPVGTLESMGRDCGLAQLRAGLARTDQASEYGQPLAERAAYADAERNARLRRIGVWAGPAAEPSGHLNQAPASSPR